MVVGAPALKEVLDLVAQSIDKGSLAVSVLQLRNGLSLQQRHHGPLLRLLEQACADGLLIKAGDTLYALPMEKTDDIPFPSLPLPAAPATLPRQRVRSLRPGAGLV